MKLLLYTQARSYDLEELPDAVDHSGFSLLDAFSEILRELGEITQIHHLEEAERIYQQCLEEKEACLLFSFTPPHLAPITLTCPVVLVFTWEYPNIPEQIEERCWLSDLRHDWRFVLSAVRGAIVLSTHTRNVIQQRMGAMYPVVAVNWPLSQCPDDLTLICRPPPHSCGGTILSIRSSVGDSQQMGLNADYIICNEDDDTSLFDPADAIDLPAPDHVKHHIRSTTPGHSVLATLIEPGLTPPPACSWDFPPVMDIRMRLRGTVYTAVLAPSLEQDNWEDLVTAFCWSFRDTEDATLMLVIDDPVPAVCQTKLVSLLTRLSPFECRVLAIYGLPSTEEYSALIRATTYCVNTSCASGSCRNIADFLAAGVPAIAPAHTALNDLINEDTAFVIRSWPGAPRAWPHGDHDIYRTSWHQIDWQSLVDGFHKSHVLATEEPAAYLMMAHLARQCALAHCSAGAIKNKIRQFLHDIVAPRLRMHHERQAISKMTPGRDHDTARLHQHS